MMVIVSTKGGRDKWQYGEYGLSGSPLLSTASLRMYIVYTHRGGFHIVPSQILETKSPEGLPNPI